jgi:hypothetical protein
LALRRFARRFALPPQLADALLFSH